MHPVKLGLVAAAILLGTTALTAPAFADSTHTCQGNADCSNVTNNNTTNNNNPHNTNINVPIAKGGEGGDGGDGGAGGNASNNFSGNSFNKIDNENKAYGGDGGNASNNFSGNSFNKNENEIKNSGNSHNDIDNTDINVNAQKQYIKDSANNRNYNTDINHNSNKQGQAQGQAQGQHQGQAQGQSQSVANSGNSSVHIENERPPVNTAYSAALATSEDTCMGSSSIGGQAVSFGLTIGTTWTDDNCQRLKNSRQLVALGYHRAATALMCFDESVSEAMNRAGTPCPSGAAAAAVVYVAPPPPRYVPSPSYAPMVPIYDDRPVKRKRKKVLPPK